MTKRVVEHKIKLEKSVKIILGVLAFGVFLNAFAPVFDVRKAFADITDKGGPMNPVWIYCKGGCNQSNDIIGEKTVYGNAYWVKYQPLLWRVVFTIQSFDIKKIWYNF